MTRAKDLLPRSIDLIKRGIKIYGDNNMSVFAGYSTLFIVTALFPFIMLIISVINLLPGYSAKDVADLLFQVLPDLEPIENLVSSMITNLQDQSSGLLASIAAVTSLWSASKGVSAIQKGLNQLEKYGVNGTEVSSGVRTMVTGTAAGILKRLLFTLILVVLIPALLVFQMLGDSILGIISSTIEKLKPEIIDTVMPDIDSFFHAGSLVIMLFALLVIVAIYAFLPTKHKALKRCLPGAVFTGVCWLAFTKLFALFMPWFFNASLYGSLASLFLMLLWLWFMVRILFTGEVLNCAIEEMRQEDALS